MTFSYWAFYIFSWFILPYTIKPTEYKVVIVHRIKSNAEKTAALARENYACKRYATAISWYQKAIDNSERGKTDSCRISAMIGIANSYRNLNKLNKTKEYLEKIELDSRFESYKNTLGYTSFLFSRTTYYRSLGDTLNCLKMIDSTINHSLRWVKADDSLLVFPYFLKGFLFLRSNYTDKALIYYKKALEAKKRTKRVDKDLINIYLGLIKIYQKKNDVNSILENLTPTIDAINHYSKRDTSMLIDFYLLQLNYFSQVGKFEEALQNIKVVEPLLLSQPNYVNSYVHCQIVKSNIYSSYGDNQRIEDVFTNILNNDRIVTKIGQEELYSIFLYLANINYDNDLFKKAIHYYTKCIKIGNKIQIDNSPCYNGLGSCNFLLGDTVKAEEYYKKAINTRIQLYGEKTYLLSREYLSYSIFLKRIGRVKEGLDYINKALAIYLKQYGGKYTETSQAYSWLGTFYLDGKQPEKALDCFQRALVSAVERFGDYTITSNPSLDDTYSGPELIEALKYKAQALDSAYHKQPSNLDLLSCEFNTYDLVLQAIHKQRTSFPEMKSKLSVSGNERSTYIGAINAAFQLFRRTGNPLYKSKAFEFAEKSRSAILLTSLKEKQAMSFGGLPDSLVEKEKSYSQLIEKYQGMLLEEKQKQSANPDIIKELDNKIFQVRNQQNDLVARFEREFPQYYQLKYTNKVLDVSTIQKRLSNNAVMLEYSVTDKNILIFAVTKDKFELIPVSRTAIFDKSLITLNKYLREVSFISQDRDVYAGFLNAGYTLYRNLIGPVLPLIKNKELIIIPDETISSIPFEVLLTGQADPMQEFSTLPYLIEQYPIGYAYSANLLFFNFKKQIPEKVRLAAFSPSYDMVARGENNQPYLKPLKFAKEEARTASEFFKGKVYDGEEATESKFKDIAENYDILHLAMHAILDNENPMYSKLAFTRQEDKKDDGYINTYELFNLKLKARMVVLSACNTGAGTLQKGEGIMSLARGFYYAGCPDVVMTLWPVEDKMSTQLIKDFYTYLSKGMNKIEALRLAKLNLIQSSDPLRSHPFFWAGYVNFGDISPVISIPKKRPTALLWVLTIGISLLLIVPMVWKKLRF